MDYWIISGVIALNWISVSGFVVVSLLTSINATLKIIAKEIK